MPTDRAFTARVTRVTRLSPTFTRVTLADADLANFAAHGFDQRINLLFLPPEADHREYPGHPDWYALWRGTPSSRRPPLRTYTVRAFRPDRCELDLDFVLHGGTGPASRWAETARPGDPLTLIGPVAGDGGPVGDVAWAPPPDARRLFLAADEAALSAAAAIAEGLPAGTQATVVLEVPQPADFGGLAAPPGVEVVWLARSRGEALTPVVRELVADLGVGPVGAERVRELPPDSPEQDVWDVPEPVTGVPGGRPAGYAWLAGEAGTVVALRRYLVGERGMDRRSVAFMGYWRRGRAQSN